MAYFIRWMYS